MRVLEYSEVSWYFCICLLEETKAYLAHMGEYAVIR
jgi:hypothetical protein